MFKSFQRTLGMETSNVSEVFISTTGIFIAMSVLVVTTQVIDGDIYPWFIVASMGASAIIVFSTPHVAMAQPWPLIGGHLVAGVCGLASWTLIPEALFAVPVAVASTALMMLVLRCRHAPGGATALFVALGGPEIEAMGWSLLWLSLLPSVLTLFAVGVLYNWPFAWRRYPYWPQESDSTEAAHICDINHADLTYASNQLNSYFDMSEQEFMELYRAAREHHDKDQETEDTDQAAKP